MKDGKNLADEEILTGILSNNLNGIIYHIYRQYAETVVSYVINNGGGRQDGEDIFQETVIAFIELVKGGKYRGDANIKTFLVSIARNNWFNELKKKKSLNQRAKLFEAGREQVNNDITEHFNRQEIREQLQSLMNKMGESCRSILSLYYYENLSFKEIVEKMHYENEQVARNKKYKCMKELTDLIRDNPILLDSIK